MPQPVRLPLYNCSFSDAISRFFTGYVQFKGRASRSEFWYAYLFVTLISLTTCWIPFISVLWQLAILVPTISISVRRLHDANMSGIWYAAYYGVGLVAMIPTMIGLFGFVGNMISYDGAVFSNSGLYLMLMTIGGLIVIADFIVWIWMMTRPSDPNGIRWDH
ncbi:DUF805 domain-containing protein [Bifidobacterium sp. SO1]|uniref:DUF805 domain-containing protein n=1 Tax=Bifidobacterium sp. SO1 TaxID=2809029 RepID=UPI001BDD2AED|nr:DUF805 domain-containing protein [Bifidobacterium sp. SO1]MBT1162105.1 DUF805 domain-containing protein [Bifidobacterium sp. SO1]